MRFSNCILILALATAGITADAASGNGAVNPGSSVASPGVGGAANPGSGDVSTTITVPVKAKNLHPQVTHVTGYCVALDEKNYRVSNAPTVKMPVANGAVNTTMTVKITIPGDKLILAKRWHCEIYPNDDPNTAFCSVGSCPPSAKSWQVTGEGGYVGVSGNF
jgi:hypothetical protein